jgi:hypothetical protein
VGYLIIGGPSCDGKERDPDKTYAHMVGQLKTSTIAYTNKCTVTTQLHKQKTETKKKTEELNVNTTSTAYQNIFRF